MSGHSKWAQIKRQKGVADTKRGQLFTKLAQEITVAARQGGGDPGANFRLRLAVQKAREHNMPSENIERAIKRGTGGLEAAALEEIVYEGYGPGGVALLVQALTDNRNRTVADVRSVFAKSGASLGENGCVAWLFEPKGFITLTQVTAPEPLELMAIDAGAEDVRVEPHGLEVYTHPQELEAVRKTLEAQGVRVLSAEIIMQAKSTVPLEEKATLQVLRLMERLEDLDDVQHVFTNAEFSEAALKQY